MTRRQRQVSELDSAQTRRQRQVSRRERAVPDASAAARRRMGIFATAAVFLFLPSTASAHLVTTGLGPIYDGMSHLILSPDDLLPALAVGLYAGLRGAAYGRRVIFVLPLSWFFGGALGLLLPGLSFSPAVAAGSFLVMGSLVASDQEIPLSIFLALTVLLGLLHGGANGASMATAHGGVRALVGMALTLFTVLALSSAFVLSLRAHWTRIAVRVAGSWILATGILLLGWSLRRAH